jgi:hypothetical protein
MSRSTFNVTSHNQSGGVTAGQATATGIGASPSPTAKESPWPKRGVIVTAIVGVATVVGVAAKIAGWGN